MFSKPLGVVLFALACLTAAAGGAYLAARHNASDAAVVAAQSPSGPAPSASTASPAAATPAPAPQPVAETEAPVTARVEPAAAPAAAGAPVAEAPAVPAPSPAPARAAVPTPARSTAKTQSVARPHDETAAARPPQRTVPMTNPGAPVTQSDPPAPQPAVPLPAASATSKAVTENARANEDSHPEPSRAPQYDELILPPASVIGLQIETSTSTERARVEDRIDARVSRDVMAEGRVAIPAGARVVGSVTTVERGGKIKEQARLGIRFHTLVLADGTQVQLHTDPVYRLGEAPAASSSKKIGGAAIGGAILGAILGGGKGAAIGGATGAAGGTAAVMAGDRSAAQLRQGEYLNVKLASPATITVERRE